MPQVLVSQLKVGERISDPVFTKRGSLLFDKGVVLASREIDILRAFLIPAISVEGRNDEQSVKEVSSPADEASAKAPASQFHQEYNQMVILIRKIMTESRSGAGYVLPILDIRRQLEALIRHLDEYQALTFRPQNMKAQDYAIHGSIMVALTSYQLARWYGLPDKDHMPIAMAGLLHDIGNAKVDSSILEKKGPLTAAELEEIRKHTVHGYQILRHVTGLNEGIKLCALQHHEREDGSGYPLGTKGDKVHLYAKVVAVADIFHAMTSPRVHKQAVSPYLVLEQLHTESFGKLDPSLVQTFIQKTTSFHTGTLVRLSDGRIGEIAFSDRGAPTRPWVKIQGEIVNLVTERSLFIQEVVQSFR